MFLIGNLLSDATTIVIRKTQSENDLHDRTSLARLLPQW